MKKLGFLTQLVPGILVVGMAWAGLAHSTPVFSEVIWPEKPVLEETNSYDPTEEDALKETEPAGKGNYKDGVFQGTGTGYGGETRVEVTVEHAQITQIDILNHHDTPSFFNRVKDSVVKAIIHQQTWEVDSVSGATYSSRGIKEAVCNALTGTESSSTVPEKKTPEKLEVSEYQVEKWKDGVYEGSAKGYGGTIKVKVSIEDGKITKIEVVSHPGETSSYYQKALAIVDRIQTAQTPNVDTVSGATYTSNGIREAVKAALTKAAGGEAETSESESDIPESTEQATTEPVEIPDGTPANGTYTGVAICEQAPFFQYNVTVKASYQKGKLKKVSLTTDDTGANASYIEHAWKRLKSALTKDITGEVDTVSGATYTSKSIKQAYRMAYAQAIECNGGTLEETKEEKPSKEEKQETSEAEMPEETESTEADAQESELADGTYSVSAWVDSDATNQTSQRGRFVSYTLSGKVTFAEGKLISIADLCVGPEAPDEEYDADGMYVSMAADGVVPSLVKKQNKNVDVISGATCSSKALIQLYETAKLKALEAWKALQAECLPEQSAEETERELELE